MADAFRPSTQLSTASPKTASEQSNTNSEKTPRKLIDMMKRVSGSQSDAALMAKASNASNDSAIRSYPTREALRGLVGSCLTCSPTFRAIERFGPLDPRRPFSLPGHDGHGP